MNITPEMMRMAQEQMSRMTPQQLAELQRAAANMPPEMAAKMGVNPEVMRTASAQMQNLSADDMARAAEQMKNMSPEDITRGMEAMSSQSAGQQQYYYKASEMLKKQGNDLVREGKFSEAEEKYRRAKTNLEADTTRAGRELRKVCMLNLSHCLLKLGRTADAAAEASAVIALDKRSLKGYYRRGAARLAAGELKDAVADLARAAALAPDDASVASALADARAAAEAAGLDVSSADADARAAVAAAAAEPAEPDGGPSLMPANIANGAAGAAPPVMDAASLARAREALRSDPSMLKNMGEMMKNMSEEQLAAMSSMTPPGMPKMTPEMARQASSMFENMSPEEMDRMMEMATKMRMPSAGGGAGGAGGPGGMPTADDMERMTEQLKDPATMSMMADMMKNISPEALASMSSAAGMNLSKEDAEKMAQAMQSMKPEHMAKLLMVTTALQRVAAKARAARAWVARNSVLVAALLVLLLALLVRRWLARRAAGRDAAAALLRDAAAVHDGALEGLADAATW